MFISVLNALFQVSLPDNLDTLYWCKLYKMPPTPVKSHMIGVSSITT